MHGLSQQPSHVPGCVHLVGAGPGDPDLLTVKAMKLLQIANVVVHDRLVSGAIMALIPAGTPRIDVGKESGRHTCPQDQINTMLFQQAQRHSVVVRLKGGDPLMFGRGGEEAAYLTARGIRVCIVPGITAAAACGAANGIPLTHRGVATGVRFVTGHASSDALPDLDWAGLANKDTTLVVYMGLGTLAQLAARLMAHGLSGHTPLMAIENGTLPDERRRLTTLSAASACLDRAGFRPPTLLIIGRVAALGATTIAATITEAANRTVAAHA